MRVTAVRGGTRVRAGTVSPPGGQSWSRSGRVCTQGRCQGQGSAGQRGSTAPAGTEIYTLRHTVLGLITVIRLLQIYFLQLSADICILLHKTVNCTQY